jgi:molybdopterin-guanine dinucleotide biosynthesis protein A
MTTAAILAGGRARRFGGRDKGLLTIDGQTIIERQLDALRGAAERVFIVANHVEQYEEFGVQAVPDVVSGAGSLGGILTALTMAGEERVLVLACDMPFVTTPFLRHVLQVGQDADVALPRSADGPHPLCACYAQTCAGPIRRRIEAGALRVQDLVATLGVREISGPELSAFDPDGQLLLNVNTPDDYARALARPQRGRD